MAVPGKARVAATCACGTDMAKHPAKQSFIKRTVALAKRNPWKVATAFLGFLAVVPGGIGGALYLSAQAEPLYPAQRYWVRDFTTDTTKPLVILVQDHDKALDYLILKDQRSALKDAKDDLHRDPQSTSAQHTIDNLQKSIDVRQKRLDDATKK